MCVLGKSPPAMEGVERDPRSSVRVGAKAEMSTVVVMLGKTDGVEARDAGIRARWSQPQRTKHLRTDPVNLYP